MKKIVLLITGAILIGVVFFVLSGGFSSENEEQQPQPERVSLFGTYVCLPQKEDTPISTDCAVGLQSEKGEYYAIDFGFMSQGMPSLTQGDQIRASGVVTPIETLSTDYWQKYPVVGIFSVTDSLEITQKDTQENQASSTFQSTAWVWQHTIMHDQTQLDAEASAFVLVFDPNLTYTSTTDCNSLHGTYSIDGEVLSLQSPTMTKMFCAESQETEYIAQLALVNSYSIEGNTLRLNLNRDYGTMIFNRQ